MQEITRIKHEDSYQLCWPGNIKRKDAIKNVRSNGIRGKIEIHHIALINEEEFTHTIYFINEINETVVALYPKG
jgi:hypothetical protein